MEHSWEDTAPLPDFAFKNHCSTLWWRYCLFVFTGHHVTVHDTSIVTIEHFIIMYKFQPCCSRSTLCKNRKYYCKKTVPFILKLRTIKRHLKNSKNQFCSEHHVIQPCRFVFNKSMSLTNELKQLSFE